MRCTEAAALRSWLFDEPRTSWLVQVFLLCDRHPNPIRLARQRVQVWSTAMHLPQLKAATEQAQATTSKPVQHGLVLSDSYFAPLRTASAPRHRSAITAVLSRLDAACPGHVWLPRDAVNVGLHAKSKFTMRPCRPKGQLCPGLAPVIAIISTAPAATQIPPSSPESRHCPGVNACFVSVSQIVQHRPLSQLITPKNPAARLLIL